MGGCALVAPVRNASLFDGTVVSQHLTRFYVKLCCQLIIGHGHPGPVLTEPTGAEVSCR